MRNKSLCLIAGIFLLLIFIFFSYLVDINLFRQIDFDVTVRLQDNISRQFDGIFSWFSILGMFEVTAVALMAILLVRRKVIAGLVNIVTFGIFHVIEIFGKSVVENIPPPEFLLRTKRLIEFPQFHVRSEYSFPSGHSGRTIFLSVLLLIFLWNYKKIPGSVKLILAACILLFDFIMLLSRVYLGEHWISDVLGGALLGVSLALLSGSLFFSKRGKPDF